MRHRLKRTPFIRSVFSIPDPSSVFLTSICHYSKVLKQRQDVLSLRQMIDTLKQAPPPKVAVYGATPLASPHLSHNAGATAAAPRWHQKKSPGAAGGS